MSIKRLYESASRYFLHRFLPHGIINWRYLLPDPPKKVRIHRRLWLAGRPSRLPLILFFFGEFILWLRWVTFAGWRRSWLVVQNLGAQITEKDGISKVEQFKYILRISLGYCIPPVEIYNFGLYRCKPDELWNYVFRQETYAFHRLRSAQPGKTRESSTILQDKLQSTRLLESRGMPVAPILGLVSHNAPFDPKTYLQKFSRLICKPRHGSASRDIFVIEESKDSFDIFATKNGMKTEQSSMIHLRKAMSKDDFLIQPFLENHPAFTAFCPTKDVVTLRLITENHAHYGLKCYSATLEMPGVSPDNKNYHVIVPINLSSGHVMGFPERRLLPQAQSYHDACYARIGNCTIPFWETILKSALLAHRSFPDIYAIAWDFVITSIGPLILEGNTGWGTETPQIIHGGLIADVILD